MTTWKWGAACGLLVGLCTIMPRAARAAASDCSTATRCAASGMTVSSASGISEESSSAISIGVAGSSSPATISVGARIAPISLRRSMAPIAWQAGHIAYYDAIMAHRCDGKTAAPAAFEALFKMGTGADPAAYPSLPALREAFVAIHAALVDIATHRSPSDPVDSPRYTNVGEALAFTLYHRGYHVGKITTLRAMIRKPRLFG